MDPGFNIRDFLDTEAMTDEEIDRCEFWVSANRIVRESQQENWQQARIAVNNTWNLDQMEEWLHGYHDNRLMEYLRFGWPLNAANTAQDASVPRNQAGARDHPEEIRTYLKNELKEGAIIGPFKRNPFGKFARFSPLDTRPKRDSDELRVILNLSYPFQGESVNHSIDKNTYGEDEEMVLKYPTADDLAKLVRRKGVKAKIMKRDLSRAYRQLFMSPKSIHLLGYFFEERYYYDVTLSMGSKSAAYCCQRTTNAITYIFNKFGYDDINYLDDLGAAEEESKAEEAYDCLGWILDTIGIRESKKKACPPACIVIFLGILYNSLTMTMQITQERLQEIKTLLQQWKNKQFATLKEVQSLLGKLNFAASTVRAGRIFVSRIINDLKTYPTSGHRRVDGELKRDVTWWLTFMEEFDGISIMPPLNWNAPDTVIQTDSCLKSCGGWAQGEAYTTDFPRWLLKKYKLHINELEMLAFVLAIRLWSDKISNKNVLAYSDSEVTVGIVNSGRATNKFAQECLREICYLTAKSNAVIKLIFLPGESNRISDCLSRWGDNEKRKLFWQLTRGYDVTFRKVADEHFRFSHDW